MRLGLDGHEGYEMTASCYTVEHLHTRIYLSHREENKKKLAEKTNKTNKFLPLWNA